MHRMGARVHQSSFTSISLVSVIFVGLAAFLQVAFDIVPGNFDGTVDRWWSMAWGVSLGAASLAVVAASRLQDERRSPGTRVLGIRIEVAGLVGASLSLLSYVAASFNMLGALAFAASPGSMAMLALCIAFAARATIIARTMRRSTRGC